MIRFIPKHAGLPPDGWTVNPVWPPDNCSWCGSEYIYWGYLRACPECDPMDVWAEIAGDIYE